jgi:hypothetical protein
MKAYWSFITLLLIALAMETTAQATLKVGDKAPDFTAKDQDGNNLAA